MIEWDLEAYHRKYVNTLAVFEKNGELFSKYVKDVKQQDDTFIFLDRSLKSFQANPVYYRFESRIYNYKEMFVTLTRRLNKSFKIGLSPDNHILYGYGIEALFFELDPLKELKYNIEESLKEEGPISEKLFITNRNVFYLNKEIGVRKGSKFVVIPQLQQEVQDALRGFECSIYQ